MEVSDHVQHRTTYGQNNSWVVESSWNLMVHGDAWEGKWRGNWQMEWVASTLTLPRNTAYPALLPLMCTPRLPVFDWTDAPADFNWLVRFAKRPNLFSARVPSHFKRSIHEIPVELLTVRCETNRPAGTIGRNCRACARNVCQEHSEVNKHIVFTCPQCHVIYHSCDKGSCRQSLLSTARRCNVCGRNLITGLTSAASPRVEISSTCKAGFTLV